jgi:hypothetical protein
VDYVVYQCGGPRSFQSGLTNPNFTPTVIASLGHEDPVEKGTIMPVILGLFGFGGSEIIVILISVAVLIFVIHRAWKRR